MSWWCCCLKTLLLSIFSFFPLRQYNVIFCRFQKNWLGVCSPNPEPLSYLRTKSTIFLTLFMACHDQTVDILLKTWPLNLYLSVFKPACIIRFPSSDWCYRHCQGLLVMVLSIIMKYYLFLKKHTQFKTRVQKPNPVWGQNDKNRYPIKNQNTFKKSYPLGPHIPIKLI